MDQIDYYEAKLAFETDSWDLFEELKNNEDIVVVDARSSQAYELEHIPGALHFPHVTMSALTAVHLDKSKIIRHLLRWYWL